MRDVSWCTSSLIHDWVRYKVFRSAYDRFHRAWENEADVHVEVLELPPLCIQI